MEEKMIETMDYGSLVDLFVKCFRLEDEITGELYGAAGLCFDAKEYILRCVAVEEAQRGKGSEVMVYDYVKR